MKQVWRTIDGTIFHEASDAAAYEKEIRDRVLMWDYSKNLADNTNDAVVVHLQGENAGKTFKQMAMENDMEFDPEGICATFDDDDTGWFYWDEITKEYRFIRDEVVDILIAANHRI